MGVHTTETPSQHTPTHTSHKYWVYTDMYSYLQVSSPNFKLVTVCKFSQPYFPILKLCFHTVQIFLRPSSFFKFFISSVSLPTAPCFAQPHCCVFVCFLSSWHWTNLNFSQPSLSTLLLHNTSQHNWHQLKSCKVLQLVIERQFFFKNNEIS